MWRDYFGFKSFGPVQREIRDCACLCCHSLTSALGTLKQFLFPLYSVLQYIDLDIPHLSQCWWLGSTGAPRAWSRRGKQLPALALPLCQLPDPPHPSCSGHGISWCSAMFWLLLADSLPEGTDLNRPQSRISALSLFITLCTLYCKYFLLCSATCRGN